MRERASLEGTLSKLASPSSEQTSDSLYLVMSPGDYFYAATEGSLSCASVVPGSFSPRHAHYAARWSPLHRQAHCTQHTFE